MSETILERVQADTRAAMKAGERGRVATLRMIADALQKEAKFGDAEEVAVLQRERKKRVEAAEAFRSGGREELAEAERAEAGVIEGYLPEQVGDGELSEIVAAAIEQSGASGPQGIGETMGMVMPKVQGRADGARVSAEVRKQLGA